MDEDANGNFRIVTQSYAWSSGQSQNSTQVSVISPSGKVIGKLSNIAPGENFQSARFIGSRLYLVTFEQIDPFFVISLADPKFLKILGELKIPGYSTYLHPYDKDRLI
jgi:inhibitor of cysteine peptidase